MKPFSPDNGTAFKEFLKTLLQLWEEISEEDAGGEIRMDEVRLKEWQSELMKMDWDEFTGSYDNTAEDNPLIARIDECLADRQVWNMKHIGDDKWGEVIREQIEHLITFAVWGRPYTLLEDCESRAELSEQS